MIRLPHLRLLAALLATSFSASQVSPLLAQSEAKPRPTKKARKEDKTPTREELIEKAKGIFAAAEAKFGAGDFAGALVSYREANDLIRSPQAYFRIAQCLEKVGTTGEAVEAYHRFLGLPPPEAMAAERALAEEAITDSKRGTLRVSSSAPSTSVEIDGRPAQPGPVSLRVDPGKHVVRVSQEGFEPATREVEIRTGEVFELAVELKGSTPPASSAASATAASSATAAAASAPPTEAPHEHPPAPARPSRPLAYGLFGLSVIGIGVGTVFGLRALSAQKDFNHAPTEGLAQKQRDSALASDVAFGSAFVLAITGIVFFQASPSPTNLTHPHDHDHDHPHSHESSLTIVPVLTPTTQGAAAFLSF